MLAALPKNQTIWQTFNVSFALWRNGFRQYLPLTLICIILASLPHFFIPELNTHDVNLLVSFIAKHQIATTVYLLFLIVSFSAILTKIQQSLSSERSNSDLQIFTFAIKKLPYTTIASIILLFLLYLGFGLFFLPGIIIGILLTAYYPLIIFDNENPITALKRSYQLVENDWWRTAVIILVPVIFSWIIAYFIEQTTAHVFTIKYKNGGEIWLLHHLLRITFTLLYFPWFCILLLIQFYALKSRSQTSQKYQIFP